MKTIKLTESQFKKLISESINEAIITEAFQSNSLRQFFQQHGGVDTKYRQFSLGDISDEQIGYIKEFSSTNDAIREMRKLIAPNQWKRSDFDMKYLFHIFTANDGTALLVGVDRNTIQTKPHWGGEYQKKVADRLWSNGWNFKTRDNRYVDDSNTYYYQSPTKDFGVKNSNDFKNKMSDNKKNLERTPKDEREKTKMHNLQRMRDYLMKYYPDTFKKLNK